MFQSPNNRALMQAAPGGGQGEASGVLGTGRVVGQSLSVALAGAVFGALGQSARLAVGYTTEARLYSGRELGRSKRVRERHIDVFDQLRPPPGSVSARELGVEAKPPKIVSPPRK
jgi:hypothetical protein